LRAAGFGSDNWLRAAAIPAAIPADTPADTPANTLSLMGDRLISILRSFVFIDLSFQS